MANELMFSFFEALWFFYDSNRGKIRRNYKGISKKFLDYNNKEINTDAFLRKPQFEALEVYIFMKEFMDNKQIYQIFDDWLNKKEPFSQASYYTNDRDQVSMFDLQAQKDETRKLFKLMKKNSEIYPNYIFALTMGLGKTLLMATCIFYEFLLANKYPKDERFCHNAIVFAPDKTVLESLKEILDFDKTKVIPKEYASVLDANIKFHFLDDTDITLNTLDNSDFNVIISNTQKIILKKKHKKETPMDKLLKLNESQKYGTSPLGEMMGELYDFDEIENEGEMLLNQRFEKLTRLRQLGIYVDEAHHMFGKDLEKALMKNSQKTSLRTTINELGKSLDARGTQVVACYNYTGTPYVKNIVLPEVVYAYSLREAIGNEYLKTVGIKGYENVKNEEFLRSAIKEFWETYGENRYEGLLPKMAIFGSKIEEVADDIRPTVEKILSELGIPQSKILVNVGDTTITKSDDIRHFNNLDKPGTEGADKQFILLVNKGREGWNCRSLFSVALFRSPKSKVFVLQATMRCLRKITDEQQHASVFLSKENMDVLETELEQNFRLSINDINNQSNTKKKVEVEVRPVPPPRKLKLKRVKHKYSVIEKKDVGEIDFQLEELDYNKYLTYIHEKRNLSDSISTKSIEANEVKLKRKYSKILLVSEIARYMNISSIRIDRLLTNSIDSIDQIIQKVNDFNELVYDHLIPTLFNHLYSVEYNIITEDVQVILLKSPEKEDHYRYKVEPNLLVSYQDSDAIKYKNKSFHADNYCFDSKPEKELFWQYIKSDKVKEIYFTGMFTSSQNGFYIQYADPQTNTLRNYYPDFIAKLDDGSYEIIEVKGDNKIDDEVVIAKKRAADEIAAESNMIYKMYPSSEIMKGYVI
ncbi:TnsA endonuclease N-terminal domain-containing protein [Maledivibacter halophilus]|uniref:Type III restriction enzyme, res subunit n=1 Tax=Maledivibacter halophilus TaxID=36842 RepID=A0A1T5MFI3_9FIRM|nr:TnsA endonuclease N-terminal domain-containing protein [Maledivibacter halophilus]SKC86977.1 Type III restriction enzyme, res subunit [Maledivibacter halophilus]